LSGTFFGKASVALAGIAFSKAKRLQIVTQFALDHGIPVTETITG
jgi:hypothetical protein